MLHRLVPWLALGLTFAACATGIDEGEETGGTGVPTNPATVTTSGQGAGSSAGGSSTTTTTTTGQGGSGAGGVMCEAPEKPCGGICVGNQVETGCSATPSCDPCPSPSSNGVAVCTPQGACAVECDDPYVPSGSECVCPGECCDDLDCGSSEVCADNQCTDDCSPGSEAFTVCTILCFAMNSQCRMDGVCECQ